jgi:apolipoprotein N-acyltransferase
VVSRDETAPPGLPIGFSAGICFSLAVAPHLLTYDLTMLILPIYWAERTRLRDDAPAAPLLGEVLYLAAICWPFYAMLNFSLVPLALLAVLFLIPRCR